MQAPRTSRDSGPAAPPFPLRTVLGLGALFAVVTAMLAKIALDAPDALRSLGAGQEQPPEPTPTVTIALPRIEPSELAALVRDETPGQRVVLERAGIEHLLGIARVLVDAHFSALGVRELEAAGEPQRPGVARITPSALLAAPREHRAAALRARGYLNELASGANEHAGTLLLADGSPVAFTVLELAEDDELAVGDSVRLDGLFLKAHRRETPEGWVDQPYLVGRRLQRSYAAAEIGPLDPALYAGLYDETAQDPPVPLAHQDAYWRMLASVRALDATSVDWSSARELDGAAVRELLQGGEAAADMRAQPFRIRAAVLRSSVRNPGENPARVEALTDSWVANASWPRGFVRLVEPRASSWVRKDEEIIAHAYFFRRASYETEAGEFAVAPIFIVHSCEKVPPQNPRAVRMLGAVFAGTLLLTVAGIAWLLWRDRHRDGEFAREQRRRRAARSPAPRAP